MNPYNMKKLSALAASFSIGMTLVGCESLTSGSSTSKKKKNDSSWSFFKKKEYQIPSTMKVFWANDILTLPGKSPTRGFGGRFYFYNEKTQAIPVDGELMVYGFDDTFKKNNTSDLGAADKRFRFTAEQFTTHFSEGELGASYSVWIPWDDAYAHQKKIMLIPTFMTKDGRLIRGDAASLHLPGKSNENPNEGMIQQISAQIPTALPNHFSSSKGSGVPSNADGTRTTTIQLPPHSVRRNFTSPDVIASLAEIQTNQVNAQNNMNLQAAHMAHAISKNLAMNSDMDFGYQRDRDERLQDTAVPDIQNKANRPSNAVFAIPNSMPIQANSIASKDVNGWAMPEFAINPTWTGLSANSPQRPPQAQAIQAAQPSVYQPR
jgi:hypothetical protein